MHKSLPLLAAALTLGLSGCTATAVSSNYAFSNNVEPIPGSITYRGQPRTRLTKSPIGSTFTHDFRINGGDRVIETYQIQPDRSLRIVDRRIIREWLTFGRWDD